MKFHFIIIIDWNIDIERGNELLCYHEAFIDGHPGQVIRPVDPCRISSESDIFHKKPIGSESVFVGFLSIGIRSGFHRNSTERDEIRPGPTRISSGSVEFR